MEILLGLPMIGAMGTLKADDLVSILLGLAILLGAAKFMGEMVSRFGYPAILGEILAGILLGPTLIGSWFPDAFSWVFPVEGHARVGLDAFMAIAVALLLLVAGIEVNLSQVLRQGKTAMCISFTGISFCFSLGFALAWFAPGWLDMAESTNPLGFALFIGIALSITALPVIAKTLMDLNILRSDLGMLVISAAMLDDLLGWLGFAVVLALIGSAAAGGVESGGAGSVAQTILLTLCFVGLVLTVGRVAIHRVLPHVHARTSWPGGVLGFVCVLGLLGAALTEWIGIHAIFGAFIVGVAVGDSPHLRERTKETVHQFITNIFAPVFFAGIGLRISFIENFDIVLVLLVLVIAIVTKVVGCSLGALLGGLSKREALAIGFGMTGRGAMEIILAGIAFDAGLITERLFVAIVIMALVTSLISGPAMQRILQRKQQKRLSAQLSERHFLPHLVSRNHRQVIEEMCREAAKWLHRDPSELAERVWQRELMMPTSLGSGLAVPHTRLDELDKPLILIGRSDYGIDLNAADGRPGRIFCLIFTSMKDPNSQLEALDMVARAFSDEQARDEAIKAATFVEFIAALRVSEQHAGNHHG